MVWVSLESKYRSGLPNPEGTNPNVGLKLTAREVAAGISMREAREPRDSQGRARITWRVADPKIFSSDNGPSIAEEMAKSPIILYLIVQIINEFSVAGNVWMGHAAIKT